MIQAQYSVSATLRPYTVVIALFAYIFSFSWIYLYCKKVACNSNASKFSHYNAQEVNHFTFRHTLDPVPLFSTYLAFLINAANAVCISRIA